MSDPVSLADPPAAPGTRITVYRYGIPARWQPPDELRQQLLLAHRLRNALVEIDLTAAVKTAEVWAEHPITAEPVAAEAAAVAVVEEARAALAAQRRTDRTGKSDPALTAALTAASAVLREAQAVRKDAQSLAYPMVKDDMLAIRKVIGVQEKALYADYAQTQGLYWATFNEVLARHRTARQRIKADRRAGRPAVFRYHRWTGEGTLAVQLQRERRHPPRSPELLASGVGRWRNVLQIQPWVPPETHAAMTPSERRRLGKGTAQFSLGDRLPKVKVPVQVHRMLPAEADVVTAGLTCRRVGSGERWALTVVARVPAPEPVAAGPAVAVHLGWRVMDDGSLRVATWRSTGPLDVPARLRMVSDGPRTAAPLVLADRDGMAGEIRLPAGWRRNSGQLESVASIRGTNLATAKKALIAHLDTHGPLPGQTEDDPPVTAGEVAEWESAGRFAELAIRLRDAPPPEAADAAAALEAWRRQDRHLWDWLSHGRGQHLGKRLDWYRQVAGWLTSVAATVVVDDIAPGALTRAPAAGETDDDHRARAARANRVQAAPAELRDLIRRAAAGRGVEVVEQQSTGLAPSGTHYTCGVRHPRPEEYAEQPVVWCPTCEAAYDQDQNAALMMLAGSGRVPAPPQVDSKNEKK